MGRDVRKVPATWQHPKTADGEFIPLHESGYPADEGEPPPDCMPNWPAAERTHLMMYEDCSEGTPISPAFATPEELARWCADNGASSFGEMTASYEAWLSVARGGWAPSMIMDARGIRSGVEFAGELKKGDK